VCHPGGGASEYDRKGNRYDEFSGDSRNDIKSMGDNYLDGDYYQSNWVESGVLEADCLMCHLNGYDWKARSLAVTGGHFYEAPTVGAGWYRNLDISESVVSSAPPKTITFEIDYSRTKIADPARLGAFITNKVPDQNCWNCHKTTNAAKRGRSWEAKTDVHKANGLSCTYCHTGGENHEIAKGDLLLGSVRNDLDGSMKGCMDCHLKGEDPRAPKPEHSFSDLHIEKIACETCHIPYKTEPAVAVVDNATTGQSIRYSTQEFIPAYPSKPAKNDFGNRWLPAFVKYKGKIKPINPMQVIWWGDWDRASRRVIPIVLWRIRDFTGANSGNGFSITNYILLEALNGSKEVNTPEEIATYLNALSQAQDKYGCRIVYHTPVLVKGETIYYLERDQLHRAPMPVRDGGFRCCEPFDLSHNVVSGKFALGSGGCEDCHSKPSPFFNRKILIAPFDSQGKPIYKEAWEILGYSKERMQELATPF